MSRLLLHFERPYRQRREGGQEERHSGGEEIYIKSPLVIWTDITIIFYTCMKWLGLLLIPEDESFKAADCHF